MGFEDVGIVIGKRKEKGGIGFGFRSLMWRKKVDSDRVRAAGTGHHKLAKELSILQLIAIGVGSTIGAGVYVLVGTVGREHSGPALTIPFLIAGIAVALSAFCYAEFASRCPSAGSAYHYSYICVGEGYIVTAGVVLAVCSTLMGSLLPQVKKDVKRTIIKKINDPRRIRLNGSIPFIAVKARVWKFISMIMAFPAFISRKMVCSSTLRNVLLILSVIYLSTITVGLEVLPTECTRSNWGAPQCCQVLSICLISDVGQQPCICEILNDPWLFGFHFGEKEMIQLLLSCELPPKIICKALSPPPVLSTTNTVSWKSKEDVIVGILSGISALIVIMMWVFGVFGWLWKKCRDCWSRAQCRCIAMQARLGPGQQCTSDRREQCKSRYIKKVESVAEEMDAAKQVENNLM